jgi:peptidoglycan/xylan/chitin deacetylase (PgdA/CDA1 family)
VARLAILSYHKVGEPAPDGWETWYYVPQEVFDRHLAQVREHGWEPIDAARLLDGLAGAMKLPEQAVHVTFDDAYRMLIEQALPVMAEHGCPGTVFVPTDYVGSFNDFDYGQSREPREAICSWDDLARMQAAGLAIQSHSAAHRAFSDLEDAELEAELERSKAAIEARLDTSVEMLAFPYGDGGRDADATSRLVQAHGYRAACLYGGGPFDPTGADAFRLTRIAVGRDTDLAAELSA